MKTFDIFYPYSDIVLSTEFVNIFVSTIKFIALMGSIWLKCRSGQIEYVSIGISKPAVNRIENSYYTINRIYTASTVIIHSL